MSLAIRMNKHITFFSIHSLFQSRSLYHVSTLILLAAVFISGCNTAHANRPHAAAPVQVVLTAARHPGNQHDQRSGNSRHSSSQGARPMTQNLAQEIPVHHGQGTAKHHHQHQQQEAEQQPSTAVPTTNVAETTTAATTLVSTQTVTDFASSTTAQQTPSSSVSSATTAQTSIFPTNAVTSTATGATSSQQQPAQSLPYQDPSVTNWTVIQQDGVAVFDVLFQLFPTSANEQYVSHSYFIGNTQVLDNVQIGQPSLHSPNQQGPPHILLPATLRFDLLLGTADLRVTVVTTAGVEYAAVLYFDVTGIAVLGENALAIKSASWRDGVELGSYKQWIDTQIALMPLQVRLSSTESSIADFQVQLAPVGRNGVANYSSAGSVDSILTAEQEKGSRGYKPCLMSEVPSSAQTTAKAERAVKLFGSNRQPTAVNMPESCGIGISDDRTLLAVRLERYLVGTYAFQMRLSSSSSTFTFLNLRYSAADVPPPVFPGSRLVLDRYGGELVEFKNVKNLQSPPRRSPLPRRNLYLRAKYPDGSFSTTPATSVTSVDPLTSVVRFTTPVWPRGQQKRTLVNRMSRSSTRKNRSVPSPSVEILFDDTTTGDSRPPSNRQIQGESPWTAWRQRQIGSNAARGQLRNVIFRGEPLRSEYESEQLADIGPCSGDFQAVANGSKTNLQLLSIRLKLDGYQSRRFSKYKATQIGRELAKAAQGRRRESVNIRFLKFDDSEREALYELISKPFKGMERVFERNIQQSIDSGVLPQRVRLSKDKIGLSDISYQNQSEVCLAALRGQGSFLSGKKHIFGPPLGIALIALGIFVAAAAFFWSRGGGDSRIQTSPSSASDLTGIDRLQAAPPADDPVILPMPQKNRHPGQQMRIQLDTESESQESIDERNLQTSDALPDSCALDHGVSDRGTLAMSSVRRNDAPWAAQAAGTVWQRPRTPIMRSERFMLRDPARTIPTPYVSGQASPDEGVNSSPTDRDASDASNTVHNENGSSTPADDDYCEFDNVVDADTGTDSFNSGSSSIIEFQRSQTIQQDLD